MYLREQLQIDAGEPPAKRAHLEEKVGVVAPTVICNGEPLEDYTKMETLPAIPKPVKVSVC